jgi:hypothetical protein
LLQSCLEKLGAIVLALVESKVNFGSYTPGPRGLEGLLDSFLPAIEKAVLFSYDLLVS